MNDKELDKIVNETEEDKKKLPERVKKLLKVIDNIKKPTSPLFTMKTVFHCPKCKSELTMKPVYLDGKDKFALFIKHYTYMKCPKCDYEYVK